MTCFLFSLKLVVFPLKLVKRCSASSSLCSLNREKTAGGRKLTRSNQNPKRPWHPSTPSVKENCVVFSSSSHFEEQRARPYSKRVEVFVRQKDSLQPSTCSAACFKRGAGLKQNFLADKNLYSYEIRQRSLLQ